MRGQPDKFSFSLILLSLRNHRQNGVWALSHFSLASVIHCVRHALVIVLTKANANIANISYQTLILINVILVPQAFLKNQILDVKNAISSTKPANCQTTNNYLLIANMQNWLINPPAPLILIQNIMMKFIQGAMVFFPVCLALRGVAHRLSNVAIIVLLVLPDSVSILEDFSYHCLHICNIL